MQIKKTDLESPLEETALTMVKDIVGAVDGVTMEKADFDPSSPPPFRIAEIRTAIPKHCWVKNPWKSLSYVFRDLCVIFALASVAIRFDTWFLWPFYWVAQGTMFWAVFVLGHDW